MKGCFLYCKDTKMKANHNIILESKYQNTGVSYIAKILK